MRKKIVVPLVIVLVVLGVAAAVAGLFISGKLVWTGNSNQSSTAKIVCGEETITAFNQAREVIAREATDTPTIDTEAQKRIAGEVKALDGYENDPTCQTILLWVGYLNKNYEETNTAYLAIKSLHEKNIFANTNLIDVQPINAYKLIAESLSPENMGKGRNGDE